MYIDIYMCVYVYSYAAYIFVLFAIHWHAPAHRACTDSMRKPIQLFPLESKKQPSNGDWAGYFLRPYDVLVHGISRCEGDCLMTKGRLAMVEEAVMCETSMGFAAMSSLLGLLAMAIRKTIRFMRPGLIAGEIKELPTLMVHFL